MNVHKAITEHVNKQNKKINDFLSLDQLREWHIEEALTLCKAGKPFTTEKINKVTQQINELARQGIVPTRKLVTDEMVREFAGKTE